MLSLLVRIAVNFSDERFPRDRVGFFSAVRGCRLPAMGMEHIAQRFDRSALVINDEDAPFHARAARVGGRHELGRRACAPTTGSWRAGLIGV
jgi:hypothetical protein